jgi:hypothetical protein
MDAARNQQAPHHENAAYPNGRLIPRMLAGYLLMQIRHNLVVREKPFFRRGSCVLKTAYHFKEGEKTRFSGCGGGQARQ